MVILSTIGSPDNATSVEAAEPGYMGDGAVYARGAKGSVCVSTDGSTTHARSAEGQASVSMGGGSIGARNAEGQASANTGGSAANARIVEVSASVSLGGKTDATRSVEVYVSTGNSTISARSTEVPASAAVTIIARSVVPASISPGVRARHLRSVNGMVVGFALVAGLVASFVAVGFALVEALAGLGRLDMIRHYFNRFNAILVER